eukprot:2147655-Rhodomonas_salina.1
MASDRIRGLQIPIAPHPDSDNEDGRRARRRVKRQSNKTGVLHQTKKKWQATEQDGRAMQEVVGG